MVRNQKANAYNDKRRYKLYGLWNGKWEILKYTRDRDFALQYFEEWSKEDGAYTKAADRVLKLVDTLTNTELASQNC